MIQRVRWAATLAALAVSVVTRSATAQEIAVHDDTPADSRSAEALLDRKVTVDLRDVSLDGAIQAIAAKAHVTVLSNSEVVGRYKRSVTLRMNSETLRSVFDRLFVGTTLLVVARPDLCLLVVDGAGNTGMAVVDDSVGVVSGIVVDSATGKPIVRATIQVDGKKMSTVTAENGRFIIREVPVGRHMLSIRLFGYQPVVRAIVVSGQELESVRLVMIPAPNVLSGVVTTATGTQRKLEIGNDITTLNVDSIMKTAPITSMTDLLENRVPGMTVVRSSGSPGDPARIRLRGTGSVTGNNDPIVIVDGVRVYAAQSDTRNGNLATSAFNESRNNGRGVTYTAPSPLDQIDPNSIETVEVFKGPSASSLYGSEAANGVIVITTKRGRTGPTLLTAALDQGISYMPGAWPVSYYRFGAGNRGSFGGGLFCAWDDLSCVVDSIVGFQALNDPRYTMFGRGQTQDVSTSVSGGTGPLSYSLTGTGSREVGLLKLPGLEADRFQKFSGTAVPGWMRRPDRYAKWGVSGQLTARPAASATLTLTSSLFNSDQQKSSLNSSIVMLQGVYIDPLQLSNTPLVTGFTERATAGSLTSTSGMNGSWQPVSWLPLTATAGLSAVQRNDETLVPYGNFGLSSGLAGADTTGFYSLRRGSSQDKTLTVGSNIAGFSDRATLAVGANLHVASETDVTASTILSPGVDRPTSFPTTDVYGAGTNVSNFGQTTFDASTYGWYLEPRLNVSSRFFVMPGFRLDGGSASGTHGGLSGGALSAFPKMNFSYLAIDRSHPRGAITLFRPRLAFGYAGTQPAPADRLRLASNEIIPGGRVTLDGSTYVPVVELTTIGNTELRPERSRELEWGGELELWGQRLSVNYTQYNKTRTDAIIPIFLAPSTGFMNVLQSKNIGVVRNTGTEVSLNASVLDTKIMSWNVQLSLSKNTNRVVRLNRDQAPIGFADGTRVVAGYPLFGRWTRAITAYDDANHDGVIEASEIRISDSLVYVGPQEPNYDVTVTPNATFFNGRLRINALVTYQNGLTQFNQGAASSGAYALVPNAPGTSFGTQAAVVASGVAGGYNSSGGSAGATESSALIGLVQTINTLRFSSLSVSYDVPRALSSHIRVPRMSVAIQGSNLGLSTNYRGKDPNVNAFANSNTNQTTDTGELPQPRTWRLRVTLGN